MRRSLVALGALIVGAAPFLGAAPSFALLRENAPGQPPVPLSTPFYKRRVPSMPPMPAGGISVSPGYLPPTLYHKHSKKKPPPTPKPGKGGLHIVSRALTKGVGCQWAGGMFVCKSKTFQTPVTTSASGQATYKLNMALTLLQNQRGASRWWYGVCGLPAPKSSGQHPDPFVLRWGDGFSSVRPFGGQSSKALFDYPKSTQFLNYLAAHKYLNGKSIKTQNAGPYLADGGVWNVQPKFQQVRMPYAASIDRRVGWMHIPGTLYIDLHLTAPAKAKRWTIAHWSYVYSISTAVSQHNPNCKKGHMPPPTKTHPKKKDWVGVRSPAACNGFYGEQFLDCRFKKSWHNPTEYYGKCNINKPFPGEFKPGPHGEPWWWKCGFSFRLVMPPNSPYR